jgi:hypothetical protein
MTLLVEEGLEGLLDVEVPHDRLVMRPAGPTPNVRGEHGRSTVSKMSSSGLSSFIGLSPHLGAHLGLGCAPQAA